MTRDTFQAVNRRIEDERRTKYCGTASIEVASLLFQDGALQKTKLSKQSCDSLKRIYREERGCRREDSRHHAKAIISQGALEAAMVNSKLSAAELLADTLPYPQLLLPESIKLECIQGCDRLAAADEVLRGENKRWVVDLFLDDLSEELRRMLVEDYDYQKRPDDGETFVKIREYQGVRGDRNPFFERMWLGRLAVSENRRKNFDQLSRHREFAAAFDALLDIPALFGGFRLSVVHQLISMRCDESNIYYLRERIYKWWHDVCGGDLHTMRQIDRLTVDALQGRAPGAYSADYDELFEKLSSGRIFSAFSQSQRELLWSNVCKNSQTFQIPSLYTFFEDRKYLARAADCLKRLVDVGLRDTVVGRLEDSFTDRNQQIDRCIVQTSNASFATIPGDVGARVDLGIRHLWLAALRVYQELPADPRKKDLLAKARATADDTTLYELASLAHRIGFESDRIAEILSNTPDRQIAERALLAARKPGKYRYDTKEQCVQQITDIFATAVVVQNLQDDDGSDIGDCGRLPRRQGVPHDRDHERDKTALFFPTLEKVAGGGQPRISSLFIRKSMYTAYFGQPPSTIKCVRDNEAGVPGYDVAMRDQPSMPTYDALPGRVELTMSMVRRGLRSDLSSTGGRSPVSEIEPRPRHITQELDDQVRLDQLRILVAAEQDTLRLLAQEEKERVARLEQLAKDEEIAQARLDVLLHNSYQQERNLSSESPSGQYLDDPVAEVMRVDDRSNEQSEQRLVLADAKGNKRTTAFAFERLMKEHGHGDRAVAKGNADRIHIEFKELHTDGELHTTDRLDVAPSDPSQVERIAGKYARKGFMLFDVHNKNLQAKSCFKHVVGSGTHVIVLKPSSRVNVIEAEAE